MNKMIETIKEIHTKDICLFKIGTFYHAYGRDAYILSYMFGYKIISKIKVIDFLLNLSYDKKLITEKKYYKLGQRLDDVIKYTSGWLKKL